MKTNLKQTIIATLIIIGMAGVVGAVVTTSADFPHRLSSFQDNDIINAGDFNNIETEIGTRIGNVATGTPQTLNWIIRNASFASTTLTVGLTASTTISGDTGTSTFVNGITLNAGCFKVAGSCLISANGTINSGTTNRFTYYSGATALSSANGFVIDASSGSTTFPTLNVGTLNATTGTSFINTLSLGNALSVPNGGTGQVSFTAGRLLYGSATDGLSVVATSSASCTSGVSCSSFTVVGGVAPSITLTSNTISGVALGGTLFGLSATNGTLTFSGTYTGASAQTVGLNLNNQNTWTASSTYPVVNAGAITATSTATFYNATTSSLAVTSSLIANVATSTITNLAVTTLVANQYPTFTVASTSLLTGTTTILLGTTIVKETWNQTICRTDVGTADLIFYNSGTTINAGTGITRVPASTASSTVSFTANNALPALTNRKVDIGNLVSSPNYVSCTVDKTVNQ